MSKANRQKYNFLTALLSQIESADDEGDELHTSWRKRLAIDGPGEADYVELLDRVSRLEQWIASLESALAELEQARSSDVGEDAEYDDDGDDDDDVEGMAIEVEHPRQPMRRDPRPVVRGSEGPRALVERRKVSSGKYEK